MNQHVPARPCETYAAACRIWQTGVQLGFHRLGPVPRHLAFDVRGHDDDLLLIGQSGALERGSEFKLAVLLLFLLSWGEALGRECGQGLAPAVRTFFVLEQSLYQPSENEREGIQVKNPQYMLMLGGPKPSHTVGPVWLPVYMGIIGFIHLRGQVC